MCNIIFHQKKKYNDIKACTMNILSVVEYPFLKPDWQKRKLIPLFVFQFPKRSRRLFWRTKRFTSWYYHRKDTNTLHTIFQIFVLLYADDTVIFSESFGHCIICSLRFTNLTSLNLEVLWFRVLNVVMLAMLRTLPHLVWQYNFAYPFFY
jgi:hypothetical protein